MAKLNEGDVMEGIFSIGLADIFANNKAHKSHINSVRGKIDSKLFQTQAFSYMFKKFKDGKDPDDVTVNLTMRLKHGSVQTAYGPNWQLLYEKSGDIGNLDRKIQQIVTTLNTSYAKKIQNVKNNWLKNNQVDKVVVNITADGIAGESSGGLIKGDIMVNATMNGEPVLNEPMSFSMKSGSSTLANLSPYNGMVDVVKRFGAVLPNEDKYRTTLGDTLKTARTQYQKREKAKLIGELYKETMQAMDKAAASNAQLFKAATFKLFRDVAFGEDLADIVDVDKTKIKESTVEYINELEQRCTSIDLRNQGENRKFFMNGTGLKYELFGFRFKKRAGEVNGEFKIKELKFYVIGGLGAYLPREKKKKK
tara:strand:+ start:1889 stop:2983 length:1095 start_codon:yes stop_codon:yes gene_type:complete